MTNTTPYHEIDLPSQGRCYSFNKADKIVVTELMQSMMF